MDGTISTGPRMAWRVDDIDPDSPIGDGGILGQNRDATLSLQRIGVHDQRAHLLVGREDLTLHQQGIDQSGLAVIDVSYDGQVTYGVVLVVAQIYSHHVPR